MFLPAGKSTKSQVWFSFSELNSSESASDHSFEFIPFKASSMVFGSSVSTAATDAASIRFHQSPVRTFSLSGGLLARCGLASSSTATCGSLMFSGSSTSFSSSNVPVKNLWLASSDFSMSKAFSTKITSRLRSIFLVSGLYSLYPFSLKGYPTKMQGIDFLWSLPLRFSSGTCTYVLQPKTFKILTSGFLPYQSS